MAGLWPSAQPDGRATHGQPVTLLGTSLPPVGRRDSTPVTTAHPGAEEGLSSSHDNRVTIPSPIRRGVLRYPLQDLWHLPWPSPCANGLGSPWVRSRGQLTTLQASLNASDWSLAPPRFAANLSIDAGGFATGDLGVSPDRTCTGWLS